MSHLDQYLRNRGGHDDLEDRVRALVDARLIERGVTEEPAAPAVDERLRPLTYEEFYGDEG